MDTKEYVENVLKTESVDFEKIREQIRTPVAIRLDHAADGMCTEAGEFKDAMKKYKFYGRPIDRTNLIEELGDLMWYIGIACDVLDVSLDEVMEININKLKVRYGDKFSETKAENRDLEKEMKVIRGENLGLEVGAECLDSTCKFVEWYHFVSDHPKMEELHGDKEQIHFAIAGGTRSVCGNFGRFTYDIKDVTCPKCKEEMTRRHF